MLTLASKNKTDYRIIIKDAVSTSVFHAAEELKSFIKQIAGADLPIFTDVSDPSEHEILVGESSHLEKLGFNIDISAFGDEGFEIKTQGEHLAIIGSEIRGTLYGVYEFLEKYLGCRWFTEDISRIPSRSEIVVGEIEDIQIPALEYRESYFNGYNDGDFFARNKNNGMSAKLEEKHGGKIKYNPFVHSFDSIISPAEYFDTHPEYFSEVDGKRSSGYSQLCLTNPEVLEIAKEKVRKWIEDNPDTNIVSVSQNDNCTYCTCEKCRAVDEYEGSHAGTLLRFVNDIAESVENDFPNVAIDTLAYQYTRKPPKYVRPRKNVIIRLCSIECCFAHPLAECGSSFADDLREWSKISRRLHIWDYVVNFAHAIAPFPNFNVLQANIKFFIENNATGIFEEGNNSTRESGELNALRQYILMKLLWNPDYDVDNGINEFLTAYYGMAAPEIRKFFDLIHNQITPDTHMHIFDSPHQAYLNAEMLSESDKIFERAERIADNETILARVKKLRLSVRYVEIVNMPMDNPNRAETVERFIADVRSSGITSYREGAGLEYTEPLLREGKI